MYSWSRIARCILTLFETCIVTTHNNVPSTLARIKEYHNCTYGSGCAVRNNTQIVVRNRRGLRIYYHNVYGPGFTLYSVIRLRILLLNTRCCLAARTLYGILRSS